MTSAVPAPPRGYSSISSMPSSMRSPQPMPAPLSRVALAAKQNQILALQALQAAAAAASSIASSSASSSVAGSPPPSSPHAKSHGAAFAISAKRGRKFQAYRAPAVAKASQAAQTPSSASPTVAQLVPLVETSVPHWSAEGSHPLFDPASGKRSEIYSLINDRYPGAPGTALAKAREAQQKAMQAAKREAAKKLASKAELEHLGVKGLGKKRKSSSPYATVGGTAPTSVTPASTSRVIQEVVSQAMSRESSKARSCTKPSSEAILQVPTSSRSRRPASRASSPAPITAQGSTSRRSGTRSGSAAPADEEVSGSGASSGRHGAPSRGNSPPDSKTHHGLASTAPFQSSPLAASAITMEPLLDTEEAEDNSKSAGGKRKASALSQEVKGVGDELEEVSKRLKQDGDAPEAEAGTGREGSPSSVSSSRRTSPRMTSRKVAGEAA